MPVFCLFEPRLTLASLRDQNALTDDLARDHWPSSGRPFPCAECMSSAFARDRSQRLCRLSAYPHPHSTIIPGKTYVTGSGGANDITTSSREVVVSLLQSPSRFVEKMPYITALGARCARWCPTSASTRRTAKATRSGSRASSGTSRRPQRWRRHERPAAGICR